MPKAMWVTFEEGSIQTGPHAFGKKVIKHWLYCSHCGLILLNNEVSRRAAKRLCEY